MLNSYWSVVRLTLGIVTTSIAALAIGQTGTREYQEPFPDPSGITWRASAGGKSYTTVLGSKRLAASPKWQKDAEHPPLSARKAIAAARKVIDQITPYGKDAKLKKPTLKLRTDGGGGGHWFWVVYFSPDDHRRYFSTFPVVVLMDGKAVQPKVDKPAHIRFDQNRTDR